MKWVKNMIPWAPPEVPQADIDTMGFTRAREKAVHDRAVLLNSTVVGAPQPDERFSLELLLKQGFKGYYEREPGDKIDAMPPQ